MSAVVAPTENHEAQVLPRRPITVDMFHRMAEAGIFAPGERVELIEGGLVDMAPIGAEHAAVVAWLTDILAASAGGRASLRVQSPIRLGSDSEPQPDLVLVRPREDYYHQAHPSPEDILLLIEVADTTARYDREVKVPLYAHHGIPEVWLLDLPEKRLEVYHGPEGGEYRHVDYYRSGKVCPKAFPDLAIDPKALGWG
jgi:Uma2 family endonuclease